MYDTINAKLMSFFIWAGLSANGSQPSIYTLGPLVLPHFDGKTFAILLAENFGAEASVCLNDPRMAARPSGLGPGADARAVVSPMPCVWEIGTPAAMVRRSWPRWTVSRMCPWLTVSRRRIAFRAVAHDEDRVLSCG
jgi:hypothetical protein